LTNIPKHDLFTKEKRGNGTELISLYVPESKRISDVVGRLKDEITGSGNIKSKQTRSNVQKALTSIISRLSNYKDIPQNGLIIFCGDIITRGDKTEFEYYCLSPPSPVKSFGYKCNSIFEIGEADALVDKGDVYGLLVLDLHEACWGKLTGSFVESLGDFDSLVPSKHSQGGQSSKRFERLRDIAVNEFFVKLGERVSASLIPINGNMKGLMIGGCGMTKDDFVKGDYLHHELRKKIIGTFDTSYTNEHGLKELVEASKDKIDRIRSNHEKGTFNEFLKQLAKDINKCSYGLQNVIDNAQTGKVKRIIISSDKSEIINMILPISKQKKFDIEIISCNSEPGKILDQAFGGVVAILRYV
jgi:peptide chain release factor subunit 1